MIDPHKVSKTLEWFFDNHSLENSDLRTIDTGVSSFTSSVNGDKVSFSMQALGVLGIFEGIMKDVYLRVQCYGGEFSIHANVGIRYDLASGGSNGNDVVRMDLDPTSYEVLAYHYSGQEPVFVKKDWVPAQES